MRVSVTNSSAVFWNIKFQQATTRRISMVFLFLGRETDDWEVWAVRSIWDFEEVFRAAASDLESYVSSTENQFLRVIGWWANLFSHTRVMKVKLNVAEEEMRESPTVTYVTNSEIMLVTLKKTSDFWYLIFLIFTWKIKLFIPQISGNHTHNNIIIYY